MNNHVYVIHITNVKVEFFQDFDGLSACVDLTTPQKDYYSLCKVKVNV